MSRSVPALLRAHELRPRKRLGQNFLVDPVALERIVEAAELDSTDAVVEVGAGVGNLTRLLAGRAGQVLAVEVDEGLIEVLREEVADLPNVSVLHGDVLGVSDFGFSHLGYVVVGNLPYYITSAVLRHFLEERPRPSRLIVTVQREVAQRVVAGPGDMSLLAVSVQFYGRPEIVARIPAGAFYPAPQVDSAVLRITVDPAPRLALAPGVTERDFFQAVRAGFSQKRKTLRNSLSGGLRLSKGEVEAALQRAGVDPRRRAETLSLEEWTEVVKELTIGS
ncbi:MAG: 16S rRNA (adenine(1518)-N(6)/adenine(1519)-N(6))-dimethyltransferase RsmA [Anaerolineae bacterium]